MRRFLTRSKERLNNERGIALILTLLVVLTLSMTTLFLVANTSNGMNHVQLRGHQIDASLMSDAGIDAYTAQVKQAVTAQNNQLTNIMDFAFPAGTTVEFDKDHSYVITDITPRLNGASKTVTFTSIGTAYGTTKTSTKTITIQP